MANTLAYVVFWSWPLVILWLLIRYPIKQAIFIAIALSTLLLPSGFSIDLPILPPLEREDIASLSLVIFLFLLGKRLHFANSGIIILIICYLGVVILSSADNGTPTLAGGKLLPGFTYHDAISSIMQFLVWIIPFFLGRHFFNSIKDNEVIFKILVVVALIYSLPMLYEIRFSPLLHRMVYGYDGSDFIQNMREGGFRSTVFVGHGLHLAFIISSCCIAALALHKNKIRIAKLSPLMVVVYLVVILILSKTWSALFYVCLAAIFIYRFSPSKQTKWALLIAAFVLLYPVWKIAGVIPDKEIISTINEYNADRGASLAFRFENEKTLLERALKKPLFGWGSQGRNRIYDNYGNDISVTDGAWILQIGIYGSLGFLFYYSILLTPLFYAMKNIRHIKEFKDQVYFATLAVILSICLVDSIPNTGMKSIHLLLAGALLGQSELLKKQNILFKKSNLNG